MAFNDTTNYFLCSEMLFVFCVLIIGIIDYTLFYSSPDLFCSPADEEEKNEEYELSGEEDDCLGGYSSESAEKAEGVCVSVCECV